MDARIHNQQDMDPASVISSIYPRLSPAVPVSGNAAEPTNMGGLLAAGMPDCMPSISRPLVKSGSAVGSSLSRWGGRPAAECPARLLAITSGPDVSFDVPILTGGGSFLQPGSSTRTSLAAAPVNSFRPVQVLASPHFPPQRTANECGTGLILCVWCSLERTLQGHGPAPRIDGDVRTGSCARHSHPTDLPVEAPVHSPLTSPGASEARPVFSKDSRS